MNKRVSTTVLAIIALAAVALLGGCSAAQKVLKTADPDIIYRYALEINEAENWKKASQLFETIEPYVAGTNREDSLLFYKARCRFKLADYETAIAELDQFRRSFGRSGFLEDAEGIYTLCHYYMSPGSTRDHKVTIQAIRVIDEFISRYPESDQVGNFEEMRDELNERLNEKSFLNAYTYYKIGRYKSAIVAFRNAMKEYPDSEYREDISFYIVASAYELARNSIDSKKEDRYLQMTDSYFTFIAEFPESEYREKVDQMLERANSYIDRQNEIRAKIAAGEKLEESDGTRLFGRKKKGLKEDREPEIFVEKEEE
ncbi:MAG: outer membrane protein assembly factor BamD [Rikenellaceae bacterium]